MSNYGFINKNIKLNDNQANAVNYLFKSMNVNNIDQLTIDDINYIQVFLEQIKTEKLNTNQNNIKFCKSIGNTKYNPSVAINANKFLSTNPSFENKYQYGGRDTQLGPLYQSVYDGPYYFDKKTTEEMGMNSQIFSEKFPGEMRNVNVESILFQGELGKVPGQRKLTEIDYNRFNLLPFDPQDTRHLIWNDEMPRGGYATRMDKKETLN